jgi:hypothetical protein
MRVKLHPKLLLAISKVELDEKGPLCKYMMSSLLVANIGRRDFSEALFG